MLDPYSYKVQQYHMSAVEKSVLAVRPKYNFIEFVLSIFPRIEYRCIFTSDAGTIKFVRRRHTGYERIYFSLFREVAARTQGI
jgi:hypothetical protein